MADPRVALTAAVEALAIHGEACGHGKRVDPECGYCDDAKIARRAKTALRQLVRPTIAVTAEELGALPFETVVRDAKGYVYEQQSSTGVARWARAGSLGDRWPDRPATVIYTPPRQEPF